MIRVLHIVPTLKRGGAEKQLALLANGLPRDEFDVHVTTLVDDGPFARTLSQASISVTNIGQSWTIDPFAYRRLRKQIRRLQPDIVHTWLFMANCYGRKAAFRERVKHVVASEQHVDAFRPWHQLVLDRRLAKRTNRIVTNSRCVRDCLVQNRIAADKLTVIPNGVSPAETAKAKSRAEILKELGLPSDARLIASIGRLTPHKRLKDLIWATDLLSCVRDDAHLLIIGEGPHRARLERFRAQCHVTDQVHFLGHRDDVQQLLPHVDCVWIASSLEGQSNVIMEAMSAKVPVIASDIAANRELVVPNETGYLVRVGDRAAFARWTNYLLDNGRTAKSMGEKGQRRMQAEFSQERMVQRHVDLYNELAQM